MSDTPRTLSLKVGVLRLSEKDDIEARFPPAFERIEIQADTLQVDGWIRLHGRALDIRARCIEARAVDGRPAVLDVSGRPAEPVFDPEAASPHLNGTPAAPDGKPGRAGGAGHDGGRVSVQVDELIGELGLAANGSAGGASERGGNGARPATVNGANGAFQKGGWPTQGRYGGGVLQPQGLRTYVSWAAGQVGGAARKGGAAGAPGQPGDGGNGGHVRLRYSGAQAPTLATIADGGAPGQPGRPATPGAPGAPGVGGLNRLYAYNLLKGGAHEQYARSGKDKWLDSWARHFKIAARAARAASGKGGAAPGDVPVQPVAAPGRAGTVQIEAVAIETFAADFDAFFLQLVAALAAQDVAAGHDERARQRQQWLARIASRAGSASSA